MNILDNIKSIKNLDKGNVLGSIESLALQCQQAWDEVKKIKIPKNYKNIKNVVINGMGGSGLGGRIIQSLFYEKLKVPVTVIHTYNLPGFVSKDTLYVVSSYSGTTEEPISTLRPALKRKAKVLGITTGAKLGQLMKRYNVPGYIINPRFNPCNQPRMGLGYAIIGLMGLFKKCGIIKLEDKEVNQIIGTVVRCHKILGVKNLYTKNPAKKLAFGIKGKIPILFGAEFLIGNTHVFSNQINENSKNFTTDFVISELNHHLLEGLSNPKAARKLLKFLIIESDLYLPRIKARFSVTKKVIKGNKFNFETYKAKGKDRIIQSFEVLLFGSYVSFYLAVLNKVNPSLIPWVDYFKKELDKF